MSKRKSNTSLANRFYIQYRIELRKVMLSNTNSKKDDMKSSFLQKKQNLIQQIQDGGTLRNTFV